MFTGIVEATGQITQVTPLGSTQKAGVELKIHAPALDFEDIKIGDSISIQGACMTVIKTSNKHFWVEVSQESLSKTAGLNQPGEVNLEKAMQLSTRLGGHLVSGHVDGLGTVSQFKPVGESWLLEITAPIDLAPYFAYKGSVTVNGVSLTVNQVADSAQNCKISINLIPHTVEVTTLKSLQVNQQVNLEIDQIARYVERIIRFKASHPDLPATLNGDSQLH